MLEGVQQRWHEYEQYYGSLVRWLADTENVLRHDPEPRALLVERKAQLDKYKVRYNHLLFFCFVFMKCDDPEPRVLVVECKALLEKYKVRYNHLLWV